MQKAQKIKNNKKQTVGLPQQLGYLNKKTVW